MASEANGPGDDAIRPRFPVPLTYFGVASVIIPEDEYQSLMKAEHYMVPSARLSRLDKDPELRRFILDRIDTQEMDHIRRAAVERFGEDRVPSASSLSRFRVNRRASQSMSALRHNGSKRG